MNLSSVASSQVMPEFCIDGEKAKPESDPALRPTTPARLGPRRLSPSFIEWQVRQALLNAICGSSAAWATTTVANRAATGNRRFAKCAMTNLHPAFLVGKGTSRGGDSSGNGILPALRAG